jgi:hypothetical protein
MTHGNDQDNGASNHAIHGFPLHYTVDGKPQTANVTERTPTEIIELAGYDPASRFLIEVMGDRRESFHDHPHKSIHLRNGQVFETSHRNLHFEVDGETIVSRDHDLSPKKIMELSGVDPHDHYLKRIGENETSFRDIADTPINVCQNERFITLRMAPTPVS